MADKLKAHEFQSRMERLNAMLHRMEQVADPEVHSYFQQIVQTLLDLHNWGLDRILGHIAGAGETGRAVLDACAQDDVVSGLLLLHGLHPLDLPTRVRQAVSGVEPQLQSLGRSAELLGVNDGVVRLRLHGSGDSYPSSLVAVRQIIEQAIYDRAPEVIGVEIEVCGEYPTTASGRRRVALPVV